MNLNQVEGTVRDLKGHVKDAAGGLVGDTGTQLDGKIDQAAGTIQAKFGDAADAVKDAASNMGASARQAGEAVYDQGAKAASVVANTVQDQPLLSLLGIAAIGYLASFLIHSPQQPLGPETPAYPPTPLLN